MKIRTFRLSSTTPLKDGAIEWISSLDTPQLQTRIATPRQVSVWEGSPEGSDPTSLFADKTMTVSAVEEKDGLVIITVTD